MTALFTGYKRFLSAIYTRLLNGADPASIGIQPPLPSQCVADWRWLRRWDIDPKRLPQNCELRFRELSFWEQYHRQVLLVLAVVLAQTALILSLLVQRRRLRNTQQVLSEECDRRAETEAFVARLRARLDRFKKERGLGVMAATIAHEINQPLIAIQNYAQAAKRRLQGDAPDTAKLVELFAKIDKQSQRAGAITQRVRSLVSNDAPRLHPVALEPLIDAVLNLLEAELTRQRCEIRRDRSAEQVKVMADPLQVQLVLVNLLQNAMQSLAAGAYDDCSILIEVRPVEESAAESAPESTPESTKQPRIQISVIDQGGGVAPERAEEMFEHFSSGRSGGMGLGLPVSRAIIEAHGGQLWHEPNPDGGAIFRFTLGAAR
ncbi:MULTISPECIES: sensor histidine kinase [Thiorhodovibrio]|uniref:sensor histidine kinase n=1 Tax=Thiorhodovibrio TaxID=61593 RepID=UPI0019114B26|nr:MULTISPECIES: ATP-binding protein [Thiorhodovibrio]WPL13706.1 Sensor protein FixL [Thiorhodovibrio litoralis]